MIANKRKAGRKRRDRYVVGWPVEETIIHGDFNCSQTSCYPATKQQAQMAVGKFADNHVIIYELVPYRPKRRKKK